MMENIFLLKSKKPLILGKKIGQGGEGKVFEICDPLDCVAKIYETPPDNIKKQKLLRMVETATPSLLKIAAWPIDLIVNANKQVRGFVMPRVVARHDIHRLYSPKNRIQVFPNADFRFLVHVGANISRAFAVIHAHGHMVGDVNHGNILIGSNGTAMLIDCDSFQINDGNKVYTCDVGVPLFTAPELHGISFRGLRREKSHDLFGLAVILFHLLFMGRHPFAGRYLGHGDMPIEKAISEYRFAYGPDRKIHQMESPPGSLSLEKMGQSLAQMFIRAFSKNNALNMRPDTTEWISSLSNLENSLKICPNVSWHNFPCEWASCPWCSFEMASGKKLFGVNLSLIKRLASFDIESFWKLIQDIQVPLYPAALDRNQPIPNNIEMPILCDVPQLSIFKEKISRGFKNMGIWMFKLSPIIIMLILLFNNPINDFLCVLTSELCGKYVEIGKIVSIIQMSVFYFFIGGLFYKISSVIKPKGILAEKIEKRKKTIDEIKLSFKMAESEWKEFISQWDKLLKNKRWTFQTKYDELVFAKLQFYDIEKRCEQELKEKNSQKENIQKTRYLDKFRIDCGKVPCIGYVRSSMLASYGIETAADIDQNKIMSIPGFGEVLTYNLLQWRESHEKNFRFNPNEPIDEHIIETIKQKYKKQQEPLITKLKQGHVELKEIRQKILSVQKEYELQRQVLWTNLKIAKIRKKSLKRK
ncbi:MAG TPA: hypothetical protein PKW18_04455 [Candidatus Sumerlaeota bacterium]|nr:MAG: Protein kinase domain protein [candidate division BRC1 bacterium ADurb.Bin183]HON51245.1 hypothetical protein [Candidatus Sumerlaeota bacterium]HOR64438.1 hypothetical protein [Candidatus Sumerlaeota bacterium]HPL73806.1 hypothetical protein [Candidatus Sumerlaeota bacterium]HRR30047.1 hypothetical protein [Candidatus Sumerlaeia bacterium]